MQDIIKDLNAEYHCLDAVVSKLDAHQWDLTTPLDQWTIKDQISHLAYFDKAARLSATDESAFLQNMEKMLTGFTTFEVMHQDVNAAWGTLSPDELLNLWRKERELLIQAYANLDPKARLPWYGPTMSAKSSATARIMETWAHGQDIIDCVRQKREATLRLKHIAHLGVSTVKWTFQNRQIAIPEDPILVELSGPNDSKWIWGPASASDRVKGNALDFCLVVTHRRNVLDTELKIVGKTAIEWMKIAQAFAGPPEDPPCPGERIIK